MLCSTFHFINVHSYAYISLLFQQFWGKPYRPLSGESLYRHEMLCRRFPSGMGPLEHQSCYSGAFMISERRGPGQGKSVSGCLSTQTFSRN